MQGNANAAEVSADFTGRTVEEALERAAAQLGVPIEQLDYVVIKETGRSILGLVRTGETTIRVRLRERPAESEEQPASRPEEAAASSEEYVLEEEEEEEEYEVGEPEAQVSPEELAEIATDVVSHLVDGMGLYAAVEVSDKGGDLDPETGEIRPLQINIVGDDLGLLIGRRGEVLRDLQFITRLIISHKIGTWPNVVVDVEGYKARRAETLRALAKRMADRVRATGQPVVLEPMPAYERRIIHLALRDDSDVYTESTGEGESRKVQILPK